LSRGIDDDIADDDDGNELGGERVEHTWEPRHGHGQKRQNVDVLEPAY